MAGPLILPVNVHDALAQTLARTTSFYAKQRADVYELDSFGLLTKEAFHQSLFRNLLRFFCVCAGGVFVSRELICMLHQVLQSFKIMDYSLLLAVHNVDQEARDKVCLVMCVYLTHRLFQ